MLIERQLEEDLVQEFQLMPELANAQVVGSRMIPEIETDTKTEQADKQSVVAVACGFRQHDAFSLSPVSIPVTITIMTRTELDPSSKVHDEVVEEVANHLSRWHRFGKEMTTALTSDRFFAGELRMDGGTGRTYSSATQTWTESISFTVRGSEKFE